MLAWTPHKPLPKQARRQRSSFLFQQHKANIQHALASPYAFQLCPPPGPKSESSIRYIRIIQNLNSHASSYSKMREINYQLVIRNQQFPYRLFMPCMYSSLQHLNEYNVCACALLVKFALYVVPCPVATTISWRRCVSPGWI